MADLDNEHQEPVDGEVMASMRNRLRTGLAESAKDIDADVDDTLRENISDGPDGFDEEYDVLDEDEKQQSWSMATNQVLDSSSARGQPRGPPRAYRAEAFSRLAPADEMEAKDGRTGQVTENQSSRRASGAIIKQGPSGAFTGRSTLSSQQIRTSSNQYNETRFKE